MKSKEVRQTSASELQSKLDESYKEIFNLRFQRAQGQLKDTNAIRKVRREIARIKTILREREFVAEKRAKEAAATVTE